MSDAEVRKTIVQGEQLIMEDVRVLVSTILGSRVAACLRDPFTGVGDKKAFGAERKPRVERAVGGDLELSGAT